MKLRSLVFALSAATIIAGNAFAQAPIIIKFSHVVFGNCVRHNKPILCKPLALNK